MADVSDLLKKVIGLIERDVEQIENISKTEGKLPHLVAQDLVKYSGALLNLSSTLDEKAEQEKKRLSRMSTEELMELAKSVIDSE